MRIAVTSQNFRTITGHAGKTRRFLILEADGRSEPIEIDRLDLQPNMSMHDYQGNDHPLFDLGLDVIITQSAGRGFTERMAQRGIQVHATSLTDPRDAATTLAAGRPLPTAPAHTHAHEPVQLNVQNN